MDDTTYYLIYERIVGRKEDDSFFLLSNGEWITDNANVIRDHLMGYDPGEPEGSPYNLSIMDEIEVISSEKAEMLIGGNA